MSIKWDKEKIILSVAGSLVTIVLGYLVWRHEQTVSTANAAAQASAQDEQDAELQQEIAALPSYTQGGGASEDVDDTGSDANVESVPTDDDLATILAAFFGTGTGTATSTTSAGSTPTTPVPPSQPSGTSPTPPPPTSGTPGTVSQLPGGSTSSTYQDTGTTATPIITTAPGRYVPIITKPTSNQQHPVS